MPSGAKKRKAAAKKKGKKGKPQTHNSTSTATTNDGSSTHSQGSDDVKSVDGRESDLSEIEHEEKVVTVGGGRKQDTGNKSKSEGQEEKNIESQSKAQNPIGGGDSNRLSEVEDSQIGCVQDKVVTVEHYAEEDSDTSIADKVFNLREQQAPVIESVKEVVPQGYDIFNKAIQSEGWTNSEPVESRKEELTLCDEKNEMSIPSLSTVHTQKGVSEVVPITDDRFDKSSSNRESSKVKFPKDLGVPATGSSGGRVDYDVKNLVDQCVSEEKVVETNRDMAYVKNGESIKGFGGQTSASGVRTSPDADNGKGVENVKHTEDQPLIGSVGMPMRRTSWLNCCGLFEVFSGSR